MKRIGWFVLLLAVITAGCHSGGQLGNDPRKPVAVAAPAPPPKVQENEINERNAWDKAQAVAKEIAADDRAPARTTPVDGNAKQ